MELKFDNKAFFHTGFGCSSHIYLYINKICGSDRMNIITRMDELQSKCFCLIGTGVIGTGKPLLGSFAFYSNNQDVEWTKT